jgi:hypothetical protein
MKRSKKLQRRAAERLKRYEDMMKDPRISNTWKHSSNPPGSNKKS